MSIVANPIGCNVTLGEGPNLDDFITAGFSQHDVYYHPHPHPENYYQLESYRQPEMPPQFQHRRTESSTPIRKKEDSPVPINSIEPAASPAPNPPHHLNGDGKEHAAGNANRNSTSVSPQSRSSARNTPHSPPVAGVKVQRPRLTDEEKRHNHNVSETRRRDHIKRSYDRIALLIPGCEDKARSENVVLDGADAYIQKVISENIDLVRQVQAKNLPVDPMTTSLLRHYEQVREDKDLMEATMAAPIKGNKLRKRSFTNFERQWNDLPGDVETKRQRLQEAVYALGIEGEDMEPLDSEASGTDSEIDRNDLSSDGNDGNEVQGQAMTNGWARTSELQDPTDPDLPESLLETLKEQAS